ncbi:di/tripeptidase [Brevibacillus aydinogluensis]|jgi:di/tripeptidase|uniref:hypothetical protein n=1 Tax=Brevibacillus aydinogluensis TaxID=927786 RepID=UPI0028929C1E|nr:hypothetical protein [Brevibacillus aydinogluensis]MDT3417140.1 di/tripeptidase [Brevibacillus aydinogluensis]
MALSIEEVKKQQAIVLAKEIERTEAALKQMKEQLKAYVEEHGPLNTGECTWDFYPRCEWKFEPDKLKKMMQDAFIELGINPFEYLKPNTTSLKKLKWGDDKLAQYGKRVETGKVFDSRKNK